MNRIYRFHCQPATPFHYHASPRLTPNALMQALALKTVPTVQQQADGSYDVEVQLTRGSIKDALVELEGALSSYGLAVAQIAVTEWLVSIARGAVLGGVGGSTIGALTKQAVTILLWTAIGAAVGALLGALQTGGPHYVANRTHAGWQIVPFGPPSAQIGPGLA